MNKSISELKSYGATTSATMRATGISLILAEQAQLGFALDRLIYRAVMYDGGGRATMGGIRTFGSLSNLGVQAGTRTSIFMQNFGSKLRLVGRSSLGSGVGIDAYLTFADPNLSYSTAGGFGLRTGISYWGAKDPRIFALYLIHLVSKQSSVNVMKEDPIVAKHYWGAGYNKAH